MTNVIHIIFVVLVLVSCDAAKESTATDRLVRNLNGTKDNRESARNDRKNPYDVKDNVAAVGKNDRVVKKNYVHPRLRALRGSNIFQRTLTKKRLRNQEEYKMINSWKKKVRNVETLFASASNHLLPPPVENHRTKILHALALPAIALPEARVILNSAATRHVQDTLGQYDYSYSGDTSSKTESRSLDGTVRGAYSYIDPYGILQQVHYIADHNGFRILSNVPPPKA